jgi:BirA family biotin operon repressor/biotin-[acetyl-CoA-carboxylase] ligase
MKRLTADGILARMREPSRFTLSVFPLVTSTNTLLREEADKGAPAGTVMIAEGQTAGRGRTGHTFFSPDGTGLYLSVLLRPDTPIEQTVTALTPAAAVAAARAIESVSDRRADVQWVNDVYCGGKKVCGILTEGRPDPQSDRLQYVIVGVGINVSPPAGGFPEEIRDRAGSVLAEEDDGTAREMLAAVFLEELMALCDHLPEIPFYEEYRRRCLRLGRDVNLLTPDGVIPAYVEDVSDRFELCVRHKN